VLIERRLGCDTHFFPHPQPAKCVTDQRILFAGIDNIIIIVAHDLQLSKPLLAGVITLAAISAIIAFVSFAGYMCPLHLPSLPLADPACFHRFVGAILKRVGGIRAFARTIAWLLGVQIVFSVLYIIAIYVEPKSEFIKQCENGSTDSKIIDTCTNKIQEVRGISVAVIVVALLLHACECLIPFTRHL
jgi:Na+-transporting methylmalonyl-CoA/oxaloacetate decarboxylase gamma subunit